MNERPILFSAPMVRALLVGTKTQTRRVAKFVPLTSGLNMRFTGLRVERRPDGDVVLQSRDGATNLNDRTKPLRCPYGKPGDQLWVREAIQLLPDQEPDDGTGVVVSAYVADGSWTVADAWPWRRKLLSPIHCPRGLSRITLEIVKVRVERLQGISNEDACAEGCSCYVCGRIMDGRSEADCHCFHRRADHRDYYMLWEQINGPGSWVANPWVWCVEFKLVSPNAQGQRAAEPSAAPQSSAATEG